MGRAVSRTDASAVFRAAGVPDINGPISAVFEYVEGKASAAGMEIKRNRGVPSGASAASMLSVEEKAVAILGTACGLTTGEIKERIDRHRDESGFDPIPSKNSNIVSKVLATYASIIEAIQADYLEEIGEWSPLTSGQNRIVWRAKMIEFYRREIVRVGGMGEDEFDDGDENGSSASPMVSKQKVVATLDKAMRPHLEFFDKLVRDDLSKYLKNPGQQLKAQAEGKRAEKIAEVYRLHKDGAIDDVEKVTRLRDLIHREDEEEVEEAGGESESEAQEGQE